MKRIGTSFVVVLFFVLPMAFSTLTASAHTAHTAHIVQKSAPLATCSADNCDGFLPHDVTNCVVSNLFFLAQKNSVYDPKAIFLGYEELWFSRACDAYWGTFFYPRFQHAISQVTSATNRVVAINEESGSGGVTTLCPCFSNTYYDGPMLGYDGTGEIDGHYASVQVCDNNGCTPFVDSAVDYQH